MMLSDKEKRELDDILQPFLDEDYVDEIPDDRKNLIEGLKEWAETEDGWYELITDAYKASKNKSFSEITHFIFEKVPPMEIVDDDELDDDERNILIPKEK